MLRSKRDRTEPDRDTGIYLTKKVTARGAAAFALAKDVLSEDESLEDLLWARLVEAFVVLHAFRCIPRSFVEAAGNKAGRLSAVSMQGFRATELPRAGSRRLARPSTKAAKGNLAMLEDARRLLLEIASFWDGLNSPGANLESTAYIAFNLGTLYARFWVRASQAEHRARRGREMTDGTRRRRRDLLTKELEKYLADDPKLTAERAIDRLKDDEPEWLQTDAEGRLWWSSGPGRKQRDVTRDTIGARLRRLRKRPVAK